MTKMLSIIISMYIVRFSDFEASFVITFKEKLRKNAPKLEIMC